MIKFLNNSMYEPYINFRKSYLEALNANQTLIQAASISSYCSDEKEVHSRFVNIKFVDDDKFIFFSNLNSPKAKQFEKHKQISVNFLWTSINLQIRILAYISKTSHNYNQAYFKTRDPKKNALAISSNQSSKIDSFSLVEKKFKDVLDHENLENCPNHWGGFVFTPYTFEFWRGNKFRLNKRDLYSKKDDIWSHAILEP